MQLTREIIVLGAVRTPIGKFGGALKDTSPAELGAAVVRESIRRAGVPPGDVGQVVFGNVIHTEAKDMYLARVAAIRGGLPVEVPSLTLNRLCGSGLQAIVSAAQSIQLGQIEVAVAGGSENMSRAPYWLSSLRWGQRINNTAAVDVMVGALTDPFDEVHMGITAENLAKKWNISREEQDEFSAESHRRAVEAIQAGRFNEQILPLSVKIGGKPTMFLVDESPRSDSTLANLAKLKPAFEKDGTVTAGNSSSINDGAAALVLAERSVAEERGLPVLGRLVDYSVTGVDPKVMGIGPVPAVKKLLQQTGLNIAQIDLFEVNEAFAAQALAVIRDLGLPLDKTNPNGSGISLGHPIGATGAILAVKALYELRRIGGRYALVTMCIGGGQGIAALFETFK